MSLDTALEKVDASISQALAMRPPVRDAEGNQLPPDGVVLVSGSNLKMEPISWLWPDWLARGKIHLLAGAPGQGKTTIAMAFAATVSQGGRWPDGSRCEPGNVLIYSGEDDPADTLAPRLLAAGADLSRCHFISGTRAAGELQPFNPATDLAQLSTAMEEVGGIDLLIVDPIVGAVTGDSHKNTETRRGLQPLVDLAAVSDCAMVGVTHFSKGSQGIDPAQRVIGSIAFTALARIVLVAAKVQSEDDRPLRLLARAKSNIGPDDGGFEYHLEQIEVQTGIHASRIAWGKAVEGTARDLLTDPDSDASEALDAADALREELTGYGWRPQPDIARAMKTLGFSTKQTRNASNKLEVIKRKSGYAGGWYWRLPGGPDIPLPAAENPQDALEDAQEAHSQDRAPWAPSEDLGTFDGLAEKEVL